jgi:GAF domain-containing protein
MAAFALPEVIPTRYYIRLDSGIAGRDTDYALLLDAVRTQTDSQTAVIYSLEPEAFQLTAVTVRSGFTPRLRDVGVTLSEATSLWLESLTGAAQGRPSSDSNFETFPEALQYHAKRLAIIPLRSEGELFGLLTLGRPEEESFDEAQLAVAQRAGRLLTALLERETLQKKLVERKLVERAKGILQQRRRLSEEQAYLYLRNSSRRRRITMASLAKEIIEVAVRPSGVPASVITRRWQTA